MARDNDTRFPVDDVVRKTLKENAPDLNQIPYVPQVTYTYHGSDHVVYHRLLKDPFRILVFEPHGTNPKVSQVNRSGLRMVKLGDKLVKPA
jgi:hypothetical protein